MSRSVRRKIASSMRKRRTDLIFRSHMEQKRKEINNSEKKINVSNEVRKARSEYVEIKGRYSKENKIKIAAFRLLYPDVKLYLFFFDDLQAKGVMEFKVRKAA